MNTKFEKCQQQDSREKQEQIKIHTELVKIQDVYNRSNIKLQHKLNLEIFEKQAELTREIHKKQSKLTKVLIISTILAALIGSAIGAILTTYTEHIWLQQKPQQSVIKETIQHHKENVGAQFHNRKKETKLSVPEELSLTNNSYKPPITYQRTGRETPVTLALAF